LSIKREFCPSVFSWNLSFVRKCKFGFIAKTPVYVRFCYFIQPQLVVGFGSQLQEVLKVTKDWLPLLSVRQLKKAACRFRRSLA
jgi:hypothetical protein